MCLHPPLKREGRIVPSEARDDPGRDQNAVLVVSAQFFKRPMDAVEHAFEILCQLMIADAQNSNPSSGQELVSRRVARPLAGS